MEQVVQMMQQNVTMRMTIIALLTYLAPNGKIVIPQSHLDGLTGKAFNFTGNVLPGEGILLEVVDTAPPATDSSCPPDKETLSG